jgi:hypothetical protein
VNHIGYVVAEAVASRLLRWFRRKPTLPELQLGTICSVTGTRAALQFIIKNDLRSVEQLRSLLKQLENGKFEEV